MADLVEDNDFDNVKRHHPKKRKKTNTLEVFIADMKDIYCRKCMTTRPGKYFYAATDKFLDSNGKMSICKYCLDDMYERFFVSEKSIDTAILKVCQAVNIKYDAVALQATHKWIETMKSKGSVVKNIFGAYFQKLIRSAGVADRTDAGDLTYQGAIDYISSNVQIIDNNIEISNNDMEYFNKVWGMGLSLDDYLFLEEAFSKWTKTTKCDTYAEELLLRELCHKENEIRKARLEKRSVDTLVRSLQEIMKNSALTPALQNAASSGKNAEAFGVWIKDIENLEPAEWYEQQEKFRDIDGIGSYIEKYITRPIKNFITGSRDFNVEEALGYDDNSDDE